MKLVNKDRKRPEDAERLQALEPVICYNPARIENYNFSIYEDGRKVMKKTNSMVVSPRSAGCLDVKAGQFFRVKSLEGSQVGDLNLWNRHNLAETFYSGKTRALHGTHVSNHRPQVKVD